MDCDHSGSSKADLFRRKVCYPKPQTPEIEGKEEELPWYYEEEEDRMTEEEISKNEGFDVDFSKYRSHNGFFPVELDDDFFVKESKTNVDLLEKLSREALDCYNREKGLEVKFANVVKANWYPCKGVNVFHHL